METIEACSYRLRVNPISVKGSLLPESGVQPCLACEPGLGMLACWTV